MLHNMSQNLSTAQHNAMISVDFAKDFNLENARIFCSLAFTAGNNISIKAASVNQQQLAEIFQQMADKLKSNQTTNLII